MFTRLKISWQIFKESSAFLCSNLDLLWFAVISTLLGLIVLTISVLIPAISSYVVLSIHGLTLNWHNFHSYIQQNHHFATVVGVLFIVLLLYLSSVVTVYCRSAIFICVFNRMHNRHVGIMESFAKIKPYFWNIFIWASIFAVAKALLNRNRGYGSQNIGGNLLATGLSWGWSLITYFILPIMIDKNVSCFKAFTLSKQALKQEWKSIITFGAFFPLLGAIYTGALILSTLINPILLFIVLFSLPIIILLLILSSPVISLLSMILKTALYIDSLQNENAVGFDKAVLTKAIVTR